MRKGYEGLECRNGDYYHKVKGTDTLWSVSKKYGVDVKELMRLNGINNVQISHIDYILVFKEEL